MPTINRWQQLVTTLYGNRMGFNPDNELVVDGEVVATQARDASGNIIGLAGSDGAILRAQYANIDNVIWDEFNIYDRGYVPNPTIFYDPDATTSLCLGTYRQPYNTLAQVNQRCVGNMAGQTLGIKRGSVSRGSVTSGGLVGVLNLKTKMCQSTAFKWITRKTLRSTTTRSSR